MKDGAKVLSVWVLLMLWLSAGAGQLLTGCSGSGSEKVITPGQGSINPFPGLRVDRQLQFPNLKGSRADVVVDRSGIQHIYADNEYDGLFIQGYLCAHERLFEMEALRRIAEGTLSELVGEIPLLGPLAASYVIDQIDLYYRTIFTTPSGTRLSKEIVENLEQGHQDVLEFVQAYCDGVNAYLADLVAGGNGARLPTQFSSSFLRVDPRTIPAYTPESIVNLTLFFLWYLCSTVDFELELAQILEAVGSETFGRVMRAAPVYPTVILPDFMSKYWTPSAGMRNYKTSAGVSREAETFLKGLPHSMLSAALGRMRQSTSVFSLGGGSAHSNDWVVSGRLTESGYPFVCNDPHLSMLSPSNFLLVHIDTKSFGNGNVHVAGGAIPGLPGILLGHNDSVAWAQTALYYDASDLYVETIVPGGSGEGDSVLFKGGTVPIQKVTETFRLGMKPDSPAKEFTIEVVPHHGPLLPGTRQGNTALSLKWIAYDPDATTDILTFFKLLSAGNLEDIFQAMDYFRTGSGNWVFADKYGNIGYSGHSRIPIREHQNLYPPYLPMPGTGEAEWIGFIPEGKLPRAANPQVGFITSSNNDVVGTTLDNDPLNDEYYLYYCRKPAFRSYRIEERLRQAMQGGETGGKVTLGDMMSIQADTVSLAGTKFVPYLLGAASRHPDSIAAPRMAEAIQRLTSWDFTTPTGVDAAYRSQPPGPGEIENSVACSIFHAWLNHFIRDSLSDEFGNHPLPGSHGEDGPQFEVKALLHALEDPSASILFDNVHTQGIVETADDIILQSLAEALDSLESLFGSSDMGEWRWGVLHTATFAFGMSNIVLPDFISPVLGPYPNDGANFTVDVGNQAGVGDEFYQVHCPQMRFVTEVRPPEFSTHIMIPCGQSGVKGDKHFDDLMPLWLNNEYVELNFTVEKVIADMETHLVFSH